MITQILEKCIAELKNENTRMDYVLGMLEVLVAMQGEKVNRELNFPPLVVPNVGGQLGVGGIAVDSTGKVTRLVKDDEGALLDAKARASLEVVKKMSHGN